MVVALQRPAAVPVVLAAAAVLMVVVFVLVVGLARNRLVVAHGVTPLVLRGVRR